MDPVNRAVQLAERVVHLRLELSRAEADLRSLLGGRGTSRKPSAPQMRPSEVGAPVSQRLRDLLKDAGKPLAWGEIVGLLGPDTKMAARAAMKKLRARKEVAFRGGKYTWVLK